VTADLVVVDKQQLLHELARRAGAVVDVLPDRITAKIFSIASISHKIA
jgi:hypothetical protein